MKFLATRTAHKEKYEGRMLWVLTAVNQKTGQVEEFVAPTLTKAMALISRAENRAAEAA